MNALVVYSSEFGNTEKIAQAITKAVDARTVLAKKATPEDLFEADTLFIGSPTQGGRPTSDMLDFINSLPAKPTNPVSVCAFDTRFAENEQNFGLRLLMRTIGYAAPKIASVLQKKGYTVICEPEGFIVKDKDGPLAEGEIERARSWALSVAKEA